MKKSILAICMLTLVVCLLSCDINTLNEFLSQTKGKFSEKKKKVEYLNVNSREGNQEGQQEEKVDVVVKNEKGVEITKDLQEKKNIELPYQTTGVLTSDEEASLIIRDAEANEIVVKVNAKLSEINLKNNELTVSLSELQNMEVDILKAKFDFDQAIRSSGNGIELGAKIKLGQIIEKIKNSKHVAMVLYDEKINALKIAKADVEIARNFVESALGESKQARVSGYYYVDRMIYNLSDARASLSKAYNIFEQVQSEMGNLKDFMKQAKEDFAALKSAHQALLGGKK